MTYDKSRVYTALNADELKIGSKVIVADSIFELKTKVENDDVVELTHIYGEEDEYRFEVEDGRTKNNIPIVTYWGLAYLVSEPEEKKLKWTDLKIGDVLRSKSSGCCYIITGYDPNGNDGCHLLYFDGSWQEDCFLEHWEKVE